MASQHRPENGEVGDVYLTRAEIAARVAELGAEIARDYAALEPILVAPLKSSVVFLADLSRALRDPAHARRHRARAVHRRHRTAASGS